MNWDPYSQYLEGMMWTIIAVGLAVFAVGLLTIGGVVYAIS